MPARSSLLVTVLLAALALHTVYARVMEDPESIRSACDRGDKWALRAMLRALPSEAAKRRALLRILPLFPDKDIIRDVLSPTELRHSTLVQSHLKYFFPVDLLEELYPVDDYLLVRRESAKYSPVDVDSAMQTFRDQRTKEVFTVNWVEKCWAMWIFDRHAGLVPTAFQDFLYNGGFAYLHYFQRSLPAEIPDDLHQDVAKVNKFYSLVKGAVPGKFMDNSRLVYYRLKKMKVGEEYLVDYLADNEGHAMLALVTKQSRSRFEVKIFDSHRLQFQHSPDQYPDSPHKAPYYGYTGLDLMEIGQLFFEGQRFPAKLLPQQAVPKSVRSRFQIKGSCAIKRMMRLAKFYLGPEDYMVCKTLTWLKFLRDLTFRPMKVFTAEKFRDLDIYGTVSPIRHLWLMLQRTPYLESRLVKQLQRIPNTTLVEKLSNKIYESLIERHENIKSMEEAKKFVNWQTEFIGAENNLVRKASASRYFSGYNGNARTNSHKASSDEPNTGNAVAGRAGRRREYSSKSSTTPKAASAPVKAEPPTKRTETNSGANSAFLPSLRPVILAAVLLVSQISFM